MTPERRIDPKGMAATSDAEVVRRVLDGEVALFEILMRRHNPKVYRAIRAILRDETEVEDAMQQAYLQAYAHLREFGGTSLFSTWLVRIAINEALGRLRTRGRLVSVEDVPEPEEDGMGRQSPEDHAASREAMALLEKAIDRLPETYRTVYMLREVEQMSTSEAAAALGLTEEAVKVRLHRAKAVLREALLAHVEAGASGAVAFLGARCDRIVAAVMSRIVSG